MLHSESSVVQKTLITLSSKQIISCAVQENKKPREHTQQPRLVKFFVRVESIGLVERMVNAVILPNIGEHIEKGFVEIFPPLLSNEHNILFSS